MPVMSDREDCEERVYNEGTLAHLNLQRKARPVRK